MHGFFLPFSLIVATIRDGQLRGPYLRVALLRGLLVVLAAVVAVAGGNISGDRSPKTAPPAGGVLVHRSKDKSKKSAPVHVNVPGLHVDLDEDTDQASVSVLGQPVPVTEVDDAAPKPPTVTERSRGAACAAAGG